MTGKQPGIGMNTNNPPLIHNPSLLIARKFDASTEIGQLLAPHNFTGAGWNHWDRRPAEEIETEMREKEIYENEEFHGIEVGSPDSYFYTLPDFDHVNAKVGPSTQMQ